MKYDINVVNVDVVVVYQNAGAETGVQLPAPGLGGGGFSNTVFPSYTRPSLFIMGLYLNLVFIPDYMEILPHPDQDLTNLYIFIYR